MNRKPWVLIALICAFAVSAASGQEKVRTERDLLGEKQVPADAYYGVQTARALGVAFGD